MQCTQVLGAVFIFAHSLILELGDCGRSTTQQKHLHMATFVECDDGGTPCYVNMDTAMRINVDKKYVTVKFSNGETRTFEDEKSMRALTLALDALRLTRE